VLLDDTEFEMGDADDIDSEVPVKGPMTTEICGLFSPPPPRGMSSMSDEELMLLPLIDCERGDCECGDCVQIFFFLRQRKAGLFYKDV